MLVIKTNQGRPRLRKHWMKTHSVWGGRVLWVRSWVLPLVAVALEPFPSGKQRLTQEKEYIGLPSLKC